MPIRSNYYSATLCLIFLLVSCQQDAGEGAAAGGQLAWGPTRSLPIDTFTSYELDLLQRTDSLLLHTDRDRLRLSFFDIRTGQVRDRVQLAEFGPDGAGFRLAFAFALAPDTLLTLASHDRSLLFFAPDGQRIADLTLDFQSYDIGTLVALTAVPPRRIGNRLYVAALPAFSPRAGVPATQQVCDVAIDLRTGEVTPAAYLPADYNGIVNNELYLYSRTVGPNGLRVYAFAASAELAVVDSTGQARSVSAASRHLTAFDPGNARPVEAQATYGPIYYDPWRHYYYRFAYLPREPVPQNLNFNLAKNPVLIVLSEDFQPLGDFLLPPNRLVPDQAYVDSAGLWISLAHPARADLNEDTSYFQLLEFLVIPD
jgi:hypothetical protein